MTNSPIMIGRAFMQGSFIGDFLLDKNQRKSILICEAAQLLLEPAFLQSHTSTALITEKSRGGDSPSLRAALMKALGEGRKSSSVLPVPKRSVY